MRLSITSITNLSVFNMGKVLS